MRSLNDCSFASKEQVYGLFRPNEGGWVLLEMFVMIMVGPRLGGRPYMNTAIPGG